MTRLEPRDVAVLVLGVALLVAGVLLWLTFDTTAYGLVSGVGVVLLYVVGQPRLEQWRRRQS